MIKDLDQETWEAMQKLAQEVGPVEGYNLTDLGNAERLVLLHKDKLLYCHLWRKWLVWDGKRWKVDTTAEVWRYAIETIRRIYAEAQAIDDREARLKVGNHAIRSESGARIREMISLAKCQTGIPVEPEEFDKAPWLLNILDGTVDLKTGNLRKHSKKDLMTKLAPVNFDPNATCPLWADFLNKIMKGNQDLIQYLQRVAGYCLTGKVGEQKLFFFFGCGANGKSTFLNVLQKILGDYAIQADPELLIVKPPGAHTTAVTDLKGARLAVTIEVQEGRRFAESHVKQSTGGDRMTGRRMHQDNMSWDPTHKFILAANHKPLVNDTTHALWRRIALIPFNYIFTEEEQIKDYHDILLKERDGILQWFLEGSRKWQKQGLGEPEEVTKATKDYRSEMDILGDFLTERCVIGQKEEVSNKVLREVYSDWCRQNGEKEINPKPFSLILQEKGFIKDRNTRSRYWKGIGIKHKMTDNDGLEALSI